jgi:Putative Ig domain
LFYPLTMKNVFSRLCGPRIHGLLPALLLAGVSTALFCASNAGAASIEITTQGLPSAVVGSPYSLQLTATGGVAPYAWTVPAGALPEGLTLSAGGLISGSPVDSGSWIFHYPFRPYITVVDSGSSSAAAAFNIAVLPAAQTPSPTPTPVVSPIPSPTPTPTTAPVTPPSRGSALAIATSALPNATVGEAYSVQLAATGGTPPYTWTVPAGALPEGLTLSAGGLVSGSPVDSGSWIFQYPFRAYITVTDSKSSTAAAAFGIMVLPGTQTPVATPTPTPPPVAGPTPTPTPSPTGQPAPTVIPQPVAGHPRLWITAADLPKLQAWATPSNPIYQQGILPVLAQATIDYNACFPDGVHPANPYPDPGDTQGYIAITPNGGLSEQDAEVFALESLIDPVPSNRILYAKYARNLIMVAMNQAVLGPLANAPFRDPLFPTYNRANLTSQAWPLVVDWIYTAVDADNQPILSAQDKATIRSVFLIWANECLNASTTGGDHPSPIGTTNSLALLPGGNAYRMASNNYYLGHARLVTMMALAIDPVDDPAVTAGVPIGALGNSIRSYIANATGAWLYQEYAMLGDPAAVRSAYGLSPTAEVGLASGGMPPEGMLYGHSYGFILGQLLAIKTAGFADTSLSGPQAALANGDPVFDRFVKAFTSSLVPAAQTPTAPFADPLTQVDSSESYLGQVYEMASYGDILRMYITPDFVEPFALLNLLDQQNGDASRVNEERWFAVNALQGGAPALISRVSSPWSWGVEDTLLTYLLLDPSAAAATDPRPGYPTAFYDAPQGRLVEHYPDWSAAGSMFDFRCSWISINHQQDDANQFELFRKGEWLTKGLANYDNNDVGQSTDYHNTLSLQNWCASNISSANPNGVPSGLQFYEPPLWAIGSQWPLGLSSGDPTVTTSVAATYTYASGDTTNLYNLPDLYTPSNSAVDILGASRSVLWLKPDHIVVYDRATSLHSGLFKRFSLTLVGTPVISGNLATTTTPGGQHLYVTSLLPNTPTTTITQSSIASAGITSIADLEPATDRIIVEDTSHPTDVRFLNVLQAADGGTAAEPASLIQSTSGTAFDGAVVAALNTVVMFKRDTATAFGGVSFEVPTNTAHLYVTGLNPNSSYSLTEVKSAAGVVVTVAVGSGFMSDSAGVLFH